MTINNSALNLPPLKRNDANNIISGINRCPRPPEFIDSSAKSIKNMRITLILKINLFDVALLVLIV